MAKRPAVYTHGQDESVVRSYRWRSVENSAAYLVPHLRPGISLLDVGCGPATITADLADRVAPGILTAIDSSAAAVERARTVLADRSTVVVARGDVHALEFPDASFDVVHAHQVLQHVTDPVEALREMRRVCRPGGVVAVRDADYEAMTWYPQEPGIADWLSLYRQVARDNGGEPDAGRRLLSWALTAGFTEVICSTSTWTYATSAEREWWAGVWADRLADSAFGTQVVREGRLSEAGQNRMIEAWRSWATKEDGWFAILHGEIIARA